METYTIIPGVGAYTVVVTAEDGTRREVGTFRSEQAAVDYLKRLQRMAEASGLLAPSSQGGQP
jgi:hypothetical protein